MLTFVPSFVSQACANWDDELRAQMIERGEDARDFDAWVTAAAEYSQHVPRPVATTADRRFYLGTCRPTHGVMTSGGSCSVRTLLAPPGSSGEFVERGQHLARLPQAVAFESGELGQHAGLDQRCDRALCISRLDVECTSHGGGVDHWLTQQKIS